jgi:hypothetical protein
MLLAASFTAYPQTNNFKWLIEQPWTTSGMDTYTTTISGFPAAYATGMVIKIKFANANTGSSTLNINSLGAKTLKKSGATNLASGDISAGQEFEVSYDGTNFQVFGIGGSGGGGTTETASNGLTKVVNDIQLGGAFTAPIVLTGSSTNTLTGVFNSLGTTQTNGAGLWFQNSTAATLGNQQISPAITLEGQGWATGVNNSQSVKFIQDVLPIQAATNPSATWRLSSSINGAAYSNGVSYNSSTGNFLVNGFFAASGSFDVYTGTNSFRARFQNSTGNFSLGTTTDAARLYILQSALSASWLPALRVDVGAHTSLTAATAFPNQVFSSATKTWVAVAGTITAQKDTEFRAITHSAATSGTFTNLFNVYMEAPLVGGAATATNAWALGLGGSFRTDAGNVFIANASGDTPTASTRLDVMGIGTTTAFGLLLESSSGTDNFGFRDDGKFFHYITPANDNALTDIIVRDGGTGELKYRTVASLPGGGGGITNTAAADELMKSNGTNAVPSGVFSTTAGDLTFGTGLAGGVRNLLAAGSDSDVALWLKGKGNSGAALIHGNGTSIIQTGGSNHLAYIENASTNTADPILYLQKATSGTPANGIGSSLIFSAETSTSNFKNGSIIESITTDVTSTSEDFDLVVKTMAAGATAAERFRVKSTGQLQLANYTSSSSYTGTAAGQLQFDASGNIITMGLYRTIITSQVIGTDANITASPGVSYFTPATTLSANRTVDVTALNTDNDYIEIYYDNQSFTVSFTGQSVYFSDNITTVGNLVIDQHYQIRRKNGRLYIIN